MSDILGPHFIDMSPVGQWCLREWLRLAKEFPPEDGEELPYEYTRALADLAREGRGKLPHVRRASDVFRSNNSRQVRVRKAVGALA